MKWAAAGPVSPVVATIALKCCLFLFKKKFTRLTKKDIPISLKERVGP